MAVLVTGGAGFIGSNLVRAVLERGERVRVLDNFSTGRWDNLRDVLGQIELVEGDIRSYHIVREAVDGMDIVFHQAALPSVPRSIKDPITTHDVGATGTLNILQAARDCRVGRVVFASSSSIYGDTPTLPKHEGMTPSPLSPYAISKLTGEHYCRVFFQLYGVETVALRYFNVFGPYQDPTSEYSAVIPKFIKLMRSGNRPIIYGDGEQTRDFTYIANVVLANLLVASVESGVAGEVFNAACHDKISLNALVNELNSNLGLDVEPIYTEERLGDIKHSFASIEKLKNTVDYSPVFNFSEGIQRTITWSAKQAIE
ncbi:MAG: SDR family oxidoreductase [Armatimonadetes bacterium]|nr:SDR family oxidoreductase [Armatimonadota bacterium]